MLHAGIEALFGRNRDHHRKRHLFRLRRNHHNHKDEADEFAALFSDRAHTDKELISDSTFAFAGMQGWRSTMEDEHKHLLAFDERSWKLWSYFSIFDGHNGERNSPFPVRRAPRSLFKASIRRRMPALTSTFIFCTH